MEKPTKFYSINQEKYIANKLGWDRVSASGSRDFHPGDIETSGWIGECKTRIKPAKKVLIKRAWWDKVVSEAQSCRKSPALFVDNGSTDNLWVVSYSTYGDIIYLTVDYPRVIRANLSFNLDELSDATIYHISDWVITLEQHSILRILTPTTIVIIKSQQSFQMFLVMATQIVIICIITKIVNIAKKWVIHTVVRIIH